VRALQDARRPRTLEDLLGRALLERLDRLDVLSRKVFAGKLPGERRSKRRGQSVEFDDYRPYVPGDDLRHIDWNVFARMDRFFLKLFREEEDLAVHVVVDCSASMDAGSPSKLVFAHQLAMAIGYVGLVNQNRVSVATFGSPGSPALSRLAPMRGRRNVQRIAEFLLASLNPEHREPSAAPADFNATMRRFALTRSGKGVFVLISDMLFREGYLPGLNHVAGVGSAGFDGYCLQVLSPDELDPSRDADTLVGDLRLTDAETGDGAEVTISAALVRRYRQRLERYLGDLEAACRARRIQHLVIPTDAELDRVLLETLRGRGLMG